MKYSILILLSIVFLNCKQEKPEQLSAQAIIDNSIKISGGQYITNSNISFKFRAMTYKAIRSSGDYSLIRMQSSGKDWIVDSLTNTGFRRSINYESVDVPDSMMTKYAASVNSVHYFSVLPFGLNDKAVNKTLLEDVSIKNSDYYTIKVTFDQYGGGEDYEDVFIYWINQDTDKVDYLAYSYDENDGKGIRFRDAYNERFVKGIRFVDYNNYKPNDTTIALTDLPLLFENKKLQLLSKIELENIDVTLN